MWAHMVVLAILGTSCAVASAQDMEAQKAYESLFGARAKQALATPAAGDDLELAGKLLEAARTGGDTVALRVLLCEKASQFAAKAVDGCGLIVGSMELIGQIVPGRRVEALARTVQLLEGLARQASKPEDCTTVAFHLVCAMLRSADAMLEANQPAGVEPLLRKAMSVASSGELPLAARVQFRMETAKAAKAMEGKLAQAQAAAKAAPGSQAATRRLGMLYLLEADDPARAAQFLGPSGAERTLVENAALAGKDLPSLDEEACWKLTQWYRALAGQATPLGRLKVLGRAQAYGQQFLTLHSQDDAKRTVAVAGVRDLEMDLARARAELSGGWIDLLSLVRPQRDLAGHLPWNATEQGLLSPGGHDDLMSIPFEPPPEYDLLVCFTCQTRGGPVGVLFPFADRQVACVMGEKENTRSGLADVNVVGVESPNNPTARNLGLAAERTYCLCLQVRRGRIRWSVNRQLLADLATDGTNLRTPARWKLPNTRALGIGGRQSKTVFHCIALREVSGRGKLAVPTSAPN